MDPAHHCNDVASATSAITASVALLFVTTGRRNIDGTASFFNRNRLALLKKSSSTKCFEHTRPDLHMLSWLFSV